MKKFPATILFIAIQFVKQTTTLKVVSTTIPTTTSTTTRTPTTTACSTDPDYFVITKTGTIVYSYTNNNVYMVFYGANGNTGLKNLKPSFNHTSPFQNGYIDEFTFKAPDIGPLTSLRVGINGTDGWYMETIIVNVPVTGLVCTFVINTWVDDEPPYVLEITVPVTNCTQNTPWATPRVCFTTTEITSPITSTTSPTSTTSASESSTTTTFSSTSSSISSSVSSTTTASLITSTITRPTDIVSTTTSTTVSSVPSTTISRTSTLVTSMESVGVSTNDSALTLNVPATSSTMQTAQSSSHATTCPANYSLDFSLKCKQKSGYYFNGSCYQIAQPYGSDCSAINKSTPGIVRSPDYFTLFSIIFQTGLTNNIYIGVPISGMSTYAVFNGLQTPDGNTITVDISGSGQCMAVQWDGESTYSIVDSTVCNGLGPWFCESESRFAQKGCEQSLATPACSIGSTIVVSNLNDCSIQCAMTTWCSGINFESTSKTCQLLIENSSTQPLVCNVGWVYYERI